MSEEQFESAEALAAEPVEAPAAAGQTGHALVDGVIASVASLDELPVAEHVAVFERAHEQLRGALDAPAGPRPPAAPGSAG
jgi:hypothetical protein